MVAPLNAIWYREEVSYIKKELIDARSRKAAAEDDLNTVKGTVETLNNSVNSLSMEGTVSFFKVQKRIRVSKFSILMVPLKGHKITTQVNH